MNRLNCEYIRDVYPDTLNGTADASTIAAVRAHVAHCANCRAEVAVIEMVHRAQPAVPHGLHERVVSAYEPVATPRPSYRRHFMLAATMAAAIIGGSLMYQSGTEPTPSVAPAQGLGFVTVEAAMVSGTTSLQDLTVEELEQLLGEMES